MLEERLERVLNVLDTHHAHFFEGLEYVLEALLQSILREQKYDR